MPPASDLAGSITRPHRQLGELLARRIERMVHECPACRHSLATLNQKLGARPRERRAAVAGGLEELRHRVDALASGMGARAADRIAVVTVETPF